MFAYHKSADNAGYSQVTIAISVGCLTLGLIGGWAVAHWIGGDSQASLASSQRATAEKHASTSSPFQADPLEWNAPMVELEPIAILPTVGSAFEANTLWENLEVSQREIGESKVISSPSQPPNQIAFPQNAAPLPQID